MNEERQMTPLATPEDDTGIKHEACIAEAWRLLGEGVYTFRAIARGVNEKTGCRHTHEWVKAALVKHGQLVADTLESGAIDSRAKYLNALYNRRAAAAGIARSPSAKDSDKVSALKVMLDCDEKIAAAEGVVTQRKAAEVSGPAGGPLHVVTTQELLANDAAVAAALDLEEALAGKDTAPGGQQPLGDGADTQ